MQAALDYYAAHQGEVDDLLRRVDAGEERYRALHEDPVWRAKMRRRQAEWKRPS